MRGADQCWRSILWSLIWCHVNACIYLPDGVLRLRTMTRSYALLHDLGQYMVQKENDCLRNLLKDSLGHWNLFIAMQQKQNLRFGILNTPPLTNHKSDHHQKISVSWHRRSLAACVKGYPLLRSQRCYLKNTELDMPTLYSATLVSKPFLRHGPSTKFTLKTTQHQTINPLHPPKRSSTLLSVHPYWRLKSEEGISSRQAANVRAPSRFGCWFWSTCTGEGNFPPAHAGRLVVAWDAMRCYGCTPFVVLQQPSEVIG